MEQTLLGSTARVPLGTNLLLLDTKLNWTFMQREKSLHSRETLNLNPPLNFLSHLYHAVFVTDA